jgi:acyl-CoA reductase-like NAD-dependent aldehyde dehydrogenase
MTAELGGVTLAVVFPDALRTEASRRDVARQVSFGALANNGQHCVSFQIVLVPVSQQAVFEHRLEQEFALAVARGGGSGACRKLVDAVAAERLTALTTELMAGGARLTPRNQPAVPI